MRPRSKKPSATAIYQRAKKLRLQCKVMAQRLRAFSDAALGKSDLKIGPASTATAMREAAELFEILASLDADAAQAKALTS